MTFKNSIHDHLTTLKACPDAVDWAAQHDSPQAAWDACDRGDRMLWIAARLAGDHGSPSHRLVVLAACACARIALRFVPADEPRPAAALALAERYGQGEAITSADLRAAAVAAAYAADAAADAATYVAIYADALKSMAGLVRGIIPEVPTSKENPL